jgi:hypothetical protein
MDVGIKKYFYVFYADIRKAVKKEMSGERKLEIGIDTDPDL